MPEYLNCGEQITHDHARVLTPDGVENPRACPFCPDIVRDGAEVRGA